MARRSGDDGRPDRVAEGDPRRGVVLLDVVLAMTVLGMIVAVAWSFAKPATSPARQRAYAEEIAALVTTDRVTAVRTGAAVATRIDVAGRRIVGGARGRLLRLPRDLDLEVSTTATCSRDDGGVVLVFAADGRSCGLRLTLARNGFVTVVDVAWLTGAVLVTGGRGGRG
jgi:Tfp pilus assembly protein FimT